ncbi:hypothetical protein JCM8097_002286 [Rhodosporidiobolus ruineniae]
MLNAPSIRTGGDPFVYTFTRLNAGDNPQDDRIVGPSTTYIAAHPQPSSLSSSEGFEIKLYQESRTGPLRVVISIQANGKGFKLSVPDRDWGTPVIVGGNPRQPFVGPFGGKKFQFCKGGPLLHKQFACWEIHDGKPRRKAAKWKREYCTGEGMLYINQDFSGEREVLLAAAIGMAVSDSVSAIDSLKR